MKTKQEILEAFMSGGWVIGYWARKSRTLSAQGGKDE